MVLLSAHKDEDIKDSVAVALKVIKPDKFCGIRGKIECDFAV
jgi:hypothetical protein